MKASRTAVLLEATKRAAAARAATKVTLGADFPAQNAFVTDPSRYLDVQCSRRAGKTNGLALRFLMTMEKHPKTTCLYLTLTQESARAIMWDVMRDLSEKFNINCTFLDSRLEIKHPNGAKLKLMGADLKDYRRKLKGRKYPGCAIDEAQDFGSEQLQALIDDVLSPSIADYADGWLAITGTPGPVPQGYFFDVTQNRKYGYSHHEWTMLENPHMPNPAGFIKELMAKREWDENHPSLLREYRNRWVLDTESLWVRYKEGVNHHDGPLPSGHKWNHVLGVDIGFNDADAIAVLAWSETSPTTYLVEEAIAPKQDITSLAEMITAYQKKYEAYKIVADFGALGKKIGEELTRRFLIPVEAADKSRKQENVELLNDALRTGKFKANKETRFVKDSYLIQIDWDKTTPDRIVIRKKPHSDIIDAVLYAFKISYAYTHEPAAPPKPAWGSQAWAEQQADGMFESELERLTNEERIRQEYGE